jgi:hypothetical protein
MEVAWVGGVRYEPPSPGGPPVSDPRDTAGRRNRAIGVMAMSRCGGAMRMIERLRTRSIGAPPLK